ncbi:hypothetical protein GCM10027169_15610 [Gordonia jinhuaensis]
MTRRIGPLGRGLGCALGRRLGFGLFGRVCFSGNRISGLGVLQDTAGIGILEQCGLGIGGPNRRFCRFGFRFFQELVKIFV